MWARWTTAVNERHIPYGYILGNHDSEADLNRRDIIALDMKNPNSYSSLSPRGVPGASNYVIPVLSSTSDDVVMNLWFFDSNDYDCLGVKGYGCVDLGAMEWYREYSAQLEKEQGGKRPGVAFMHIPPPEYMYAYDVEIAFGFHLSIIRLSETKQRIYVVLR